MRYLFRGVLAVAVLISALLLITSCGKETVYIVEKTPDSTVEVPSDNGGYSDSSGYPLTSAEQEYIDGVDDLMGLTLNLPQDELLAVGYGICTSLRAGESVEELYLGLLGAVGYTDEDADFVSSIMASAVYSLCPDQIYKVEQLAV